MNSSFGYCDDHHDLRSNEKNVFCIDCEVRMCRHCKETHSLHRTFQIYKYSYQDVFRHSELQKYFDCSKIQISLHPVEPQNHYSQRKSSECTTAPKPDPVDYTLNDNHNSEPESSISEARPCELIEVVNFRKRPRKTAPLQRPLFVFIS
ncbi:unnamed protein product [Lupinus luteus]|uniref:B box-type domain-containing protein n=1 Tax=Lupinus luteus TaxID=3873 RepID=A0AAV1YB83_LUPLU